MPLTQSWHNQDFATSQDDARFPVTWDRLAGHWPASLGVTGLTLFDVSGGQNNGVVNGATWNSTGSLNYFAGTDHVSLFEQIDVPVLFELQTEISLSFWVRHGTVTHDHTLFCEGDFGGASNLLIFGDDDTTDRYKFIVNGSGTLLPNATVDANQWVHIVLTFVGGSEFRFFKNGKEDANSPFATAVTTTGGTWNTVFLGNNKNLTSKTFVGDMGDVAYWQRAITPSEVQLHYTRGLAGSSAILERKARSYPAATAAPPAVAIMNQLQGSNLGADLYNGALA